MKEIPQTILPTWLKPQEIKGKKGWLILTYIQPGASQTRIKGTYQDRLKIAVQAPPVDGAANEAVIGFLAKNLKIAPSKIHLLSGEASRMKNLWMEVSSSTSSIDAILLAFET